MTLTFDPGVYTQIQSSLITSFSAALATISDYSQDLLYLAASIEIVLFALLWALQANQAFGRLVFTVLKIGFLLMVINNFDLWLNALLDSFGQIATSTANGDIAIKLMEAPGDIWQYGYNSAITLLKAAAADNVNVALGRILTILGFGILLVYGLLGARLIVQMAAFYVTALIALLFIPLGILKPTADFAYRGLQRVLKSATELFTLLLVLALATRIWQSNAMALSDKFNLNQVLAILFSGLVFLLLAQTLPKIAGAAVGHIKPLLPDGSWNTSSSTISAASTGITPDTRSALQAATAIDPTPNGASLSAHFASSVHIEPSSPTASGGSLTPSMKPRADDQRRFGSATAVAPSISGSTLQKLNSTRQASGE